MSINNQGSFFNNLPYNYGANNTPINKGVPLNPLNEIVPVPLKPQNQQTPLLNVLNGTKDMLQTISKELEVLNSQQSVNMIKDLLKFPKQFEQLVIQLTTDAKLTNQQTALLLLAVKINLPEVSQFLQNASKEAMTNLYKMIASYNQLGVSMKNEQLSHLTKLISFVSASSNSDIQSLKTVMLMYLPWLPLTDKEAFKLEIAHSNSESEQAVGIDSVGVLMSNRNYGNVQAQILKTDEDGIKIEVISSQTFPLKAFSELMMIESKRYNININFDFATKENYNKEKVETTQTQVFLNTSPGINPFLLLISNALIKNIHEIDEKESLRWNKKEKSENGKS